MKINYLKIFQNEIFLSALLMEIFFLLLAFIDYPLREIFQDKSLSPRNEMILLYLLLIFIGLLIAYFLIYDWAKKNNQLLKDNFKIIILFFIIFQLTLLFIPPIGSADVYTYILRTKILTHYQQNPFVVPAANFPSDPLINFTDKSANGIPLMYGPLWLTISLIAVVLGKSSVTLTVLLFKLTAIIFSCLTCYLVFKILGHLKKDYQYLGTVMYAFNPLLLFEIANNGHNDIIMMFFVILGLYYFLKSKYYLGLIVLICAVLIKYIALILLPILGLFVLNNLRGKYKKVKFGLSLLFFCFIVFWLNWLLGGKTSFILQGIKTITDFFYPHLLPPLSFLIYLFSTNLPLEVQKLVVKGLGGILFFIVYLYLLIDILWHKRGSSINLIIFSSLAIFFYLIFTVNQLMSWYLIWFLPLAILIKPHLKLSNFLTGFVPICFYIFLYPLGYFLLLMGVFFCFFFKKVLYSNVNK
jgi:hypothetical protein